MTAGTDEEPKPEDGEKYKKYKALEAVLSSIQLKVCYVPLGKNVIEGEITEVKKMNLEYTKTVHTVFFYMIIQNNGTNLIYQDNKLMNLYYHSRQRYYRSLILL